MSNLKNNNKIDANIFLDNLNSLIDEALKEHGFEIVKLQMVTQGRQFVFRFFIDKLVEPTGEITLQETFVSLEDCTFVSRLISKIIDEKVEIEQLPEPDNYSIEVSSPGIDRPLVKERDFYRFHGKNIKLKLKQNDVNRTYKGLLASEDDNLLLIEETGNKVFFTFTDVINANLLISDNLFKNS